MTRFDCFTYKKGILHCEGKSLEDLAALFGTPFYVYSYEALENQFQNLKNAFSKINPLICYSVKANPNGAILKTFFRLGSGADVVSSGELKRALQTGCDPKKIVFSGVGKTKEEIAFALEKDVLQFNVEGEQELDAIQTLAKQRRKKARIAFRVNPDVDAQTHPYISTGLKKNKFGIPHKEALALYQKAQALDSLDVQGIACHIGSQITDLLPFKESVQTIRDLVLKLKAKNIILKTIDLGGGLGIPYREKDLVVNVKDYAELVFESLKDFSCQILLEPGRFLTGNAGAFVTEVLYTKTNEGKHFTIVDGAFNDLMRPMLYNAYHEILPVQKTDRKMITTDVVGPICETTDTFASERKLPEVEPRDHLAIMSSGAYGASMASFYNSRPRPKEILVKGEEAFVIKESESLEDLIALEMMPDFLNQNANV